MSTITIVHDTASGGVLRKLEEENFDRKREIYCYGEITQELANDLILQMRYLQDQDPGKPITMCINSGGGSISAGLAIYDVMHGLTCPVNTTCTALAASMAAILFVSGTVRSIYPHGEIMIHDPLLCTMPGGSALQIQQIGDRLMHHRAAMAKILANHSGHSVDEILKLTQNDTYFSASDAIAYGLANCIVRKY